MGGARAGVVDGTESEREKGRAIARDVSNRVSYRSRLAFVHQSSCSKWGGANERGRSCALALALGQGAGSEEEAKEAGACRR